MILFSRSTASEGCAAAMPASASVTRVSALLMSFFMTCLPGFFGNDGQVRRFARGREGHGNRRVDFSRRSYGFARRLSRGKAGGGGRTSSLRASYVSGMLFGIVEQDLV